MKKLLLILLLCSSAMAQQPPWSASTSYNQTFRTYSATAAAVTPFATPTDLCTLAGNPTTTIRVTRVIVSSTQTTSGVNVFYLTKRSTIDGGTGTAMTVVPHDSGSGPAKALPYSWPSPGVSPSPQPSPLGTFVGNLAAFHLVSPNPATTAVVASPYVSQYDSDNTSNPITLHSTEQLSVNFNGAALPPGLSLNCTFEWTEF